MVENRNKVDLTANRFISVAEGLLVSLNSVENRLAPVLTRRDRTDVDRIIKDIGDALRRLDVFRESLEEGDRQYLDRLVKVTEGRIHIGLGNLKGLLVGPSTTCHEGKLEFCDEKEAQPQAAQASMPTSSSLQYLNEAETIKSLCSDIEQIHEIMLETAKMIRQQGEIVDQIDDNIEQTAENLSVGASDLRWAAKLKIASFPLIGAIAGVVAAGPVGLLVGLKLTGCAGCILAGGALGAFGGRVVQKKVGGELEFLTEEPVEPKKSV